MMDEMNEDDGVAVQLNIKNIYGEKKREGGDHYVTRPLLKSLTGRHVATVLLISYVQFIVHRKTLLYFNTL